MACNCFYCDAEKAEPHLDGCPQKIYQEKSEKVFGGASTNIEVVGTAFTATCREIDTEAEEAIAQWNRGYGDGLKVKAVRQPSDHPSYALGLSRAIEEDGAEILHSKLNLRETQ